jgi:ribosomal protein S16
MAYSICGSDNIQNLPDLYFHTASLDQIVTYAGGGGNCAATNATGNGSPTISPLSNFTIPANTPFVLTGSATDPNGDALTFSWEEYDLGNPSPPNTDDGTRPLFRSFTPSTSASRTFPSLQYILNNANVPPANYACGSATCLTGEVLPSTTRTMNFRFTARDNRASGGGTTNASQQVSVASSAGPFAVTQPNTGVSWAGNSNQTITWNVAGTSAAPINVANVKISLSTDGGNTFPLVLSASTPNDGAESVAIPNTPTSLARVKVEAVGNIFFDVSDVNFTIVQGTGGSTDTIGLFNPAASTFFLRNSASTGVADLSFGYGPGGAGWTPLVGDWNGDGVDTIGLYNPNNAVFYLRNSNSTGVADITFLYGPAGQGWIPLVGDWNGDRVDTVGLYNPANGVFYLRNSNSTGVADITFLYGPSGQGWIPLVGDWDGDGVDTIGLYNPANGVFYLRNSNSTGVADLTFLYGPSGQGWIPLVGDWDGDGVDTIGLYNPSNGVFYLRNSNSTGVADLTFLYGPSGVGWTPLIGDWDGL